MHSSGSRRPPAPAGIAVAAPTVTAPAAEVYGPKRNQTQQTGAVVHKNMTAPPAAVDGHTAPPDPAAEAVIPAMPPIATGKRILTGSKNTWQDPAKQTEARRKPPFLQKEGQPPPLQNHRRLRGNRPNTLLGFSSGQPSWLLRPQAGRRAR